MLQPPFALIQYIISQHTHPHVCYIFACIIVYFRCIFST